VQYATQTVAVKRLNSTQNPIWAGVRLSKNFVLHVLSIYLFSTRNPRRTCTAMSRDYP
ncbi:hypothetical protein J6590_100540, partial [Homalodisca vitripennis]